MIALTDAIKFRIAAMAACVLLVLAGVQTWRLHALQADHAALAASVAADRADRATAYAQDSEQTAKKEQTHAAATIAASDTFTAGAPERESTLRAQLADARRLLDSTEQRAARYRAQAEADATSCRRLADRSTVLDRSLAEGRLVVAELRGVVERRDAEVKLLADLLDADESLLKEE